MNGSNRTQTGTQGDKGIVGFQGTQGLQGTQGDKGHQGTQGLRGITGDGGTQGYQGTQGNKGTQGDKGTQGVTGTQGPIGTKGPIGTQGPTGTVGTQGPTGTRGPIGTMGPIGTRGVIGTQGPTGTQGDKGTKGDQGPTGTRGVIGTQGPTGTQGPRGTQGDKGTRGDQGVIGTQGAIGTQGLAGSVKVLKYWDQLANAKIYNGSADASIDDGLSLRQALNIRNTFDSGTTIATGIGSHYVNLRGEVAVYYSTIWHDTAGNEATILALRNPVTSFIVKSGDSGAMQTRATSFTAAGYVPSIQVKGQSLYVNKLIANGVSPAYNFYVEGTSYLNGDVSVGGNIIPLQGTSDTPALSEYNIGSTNRFWNGAYVNIITARYLHNDGSNANGVGTQANPWKHGYFETTYVKNMYPATNLGTTSIGDIDFIWNTSFVDTVLAHSIEPIPDEIPEDYTYEIGKSDRYWDFSYIDTMYSQFLYANPSSSAATSIGNSNKAWWQSYICFMYANTLSPASVNTSTNVLKYVIPSSVGQLGKCVNVSTNGATVAQWHTAFIGHTYSLANGYFYNQSSTYDTLVNNGPIFIGYMRQTSTYTHARMACVNYYSPRLSGESLTTYTGVRVTDSSSSTAFSADSSTFAPRGYAYAHAAGHYWIYFSSKVKLDPTTTVVQLTNVTGSTNNYSYVHGLRLGGEIAQIHHSSSGAADSYYTYRIIIMLSSLESNRSSKFENDSGIYIVVYDIGAKYTASQVITKNVF